MGYVYDTDEMKIQRNGEIHKYVAAEHTDAYCATVKQSAESGEQLEVAPKEEEERPGPPKAPDGGWGWVVLVVSILSFLVRSGVHHGFPVMYTDLIEYFDEPTSVVAWVSSLQNATQLLSGFFVGSLIDKYGCRLVAFVGALILSSSLFISAFAPNVYVLYFTYGILGGFGAGCLNLSSIIIVQVYFDKRRSMASGLSMSGVGLSGFVYGPLTRYLLEQYTWRGTMMLLAGITLHGAALALFYRPLPAKYSNAHRRKQNRNMCKDIFDFSLLKNKKFVFFSSASFMSAFGTSSFMSHYANRAVHTGVDRNLAALLPSILGITHCVSRILFGFVGNIKGINRVAQYGIGASLCGVVTALFGIFHSYLHQAVFTAVRGIVAGIYLSIYNTTLVDLVGVSLVAKSTGINWIFVGIAQLLSPPFAGWIFDVTSDYDLPFFIAGAAQTFAGLICLTGLVLIPRLLTLRARCRQEAHIFLRETTV